MNRRHLYSLAAVLAAAGIGLFAYKSMVLGFPVMPDEQAELWTIEARVGFRRHTPGSAKVRLEIPRHLVGFGVLNENFVSRGYGLSTRERGNYRQALWAIRRVQGDQSLYYRVTVFRDAKAYPQMETPPFPQVPELEEPYASAMQDVLREVRRESADVATFASSLLQRMDRTDRDDDIALFTAETRSPLQRATAAKTLLAGARIPSQVLQTVPLRDSPRRVEVVPWLAVHNGESWLYFDPETGDQGLPHDLFIWTWSDSRLVNVRGGLEESVEFWVKRSVEDALSVAERRAEAHDSRLVEFSLLGLPVQTQAVYSILLMIPVGALVIVLMRNMVGVRTFGTFMPVLVALAFRETRLLSGVVLFSLIVGVGLAIRFYLEKLRLLLVPRLASVLTVVVLLMMAVSILSHRLGVEIGLSVALFPMVIMTMVIERMSVVWEERGASDAILEGLGTLLVAALAYGIMGLNGIENLVFVFPEVLLVVLATTLLIGRYTGYRLTDLRRFGALTGRRK